MSSIKRIFHRHSQPEPEDPPPDYPDDQKSMSGESQVAGLSATALPSGVENIVFHVYKAGGMMSRDDIITTERDKSKIEYYLHFPYTWTGRWEITLKRFGPEGPLVCSIEKSGYSSDKLIVMPNGWTTPLIRPSGFSSSHEYVGFDGKTNWKWKSNMMASEFTLYRQPEGGEREAAAWWSTSTMSISKDGKLAIDPRYANELELILATGLAVQEWAGEQRRGGY